MRCTHHTFDIVRCSHYTCDAPTHHTYVVLSAGGQAVQDGRDDAECDPQEAQHDPAGH